MNPNIFREYDIRGVADRDLDDTTVRALGTAIGELAAGRVIVGRDPRTHSGRLFSTLTDGLRVHAEVLDIGVVPTPVVYFAAHYLQSAGAVMITGSHNPRDDNGFKIMIGSETMHGVAISTLRARVGQLTAEPAAQPTQQIHTFSVIEAYLEHAIENLRPGKRRFRVVVDAGNGAGGPTAIELYKRLGFDVIPLYCELDGTFPNHHPDPTLPENLADLITTVQHVGAEIGIALDGDADRLGVVDATGKILWGDQLMIILGRAVLDEVPGARFIGEVKCSQAMYDELTAAGGSVEMWKVGHSLIKARMKTTGAALAGEMSGHLFFAHRWLGFDDGIYAGARLLELLSRGTRTLAELASELPMMSSTPEIRIDCTDDQKIRLVTAVISRLRHDPAVISVIDIDGVRANFADGWGLLRASNTQPALVMRCEASSPARLEEIRKTLEGHLTAAKRAQECVGLALGNEGTRHQ
jgi:phosphomannomutase/phosphoglucomutase